MTEQTPKRSEHWSELHSKNSHSMDYISKIVIMGDGGAGKTCLLERLCNNIFREGTTLTIGVGFYLNKIQVDDTNNIFEGKDKTNITLQLWDIGGQDRFAPLRKPYFDGAQLCGLVYDIRTFSRFNNLGKWMNELHETLGYYIPTVLIGTKSDNNELRVIKKETAEKYAIELKELTGYTVPFFETSAKEDANSVKKVFQKLGEMCYDTYLAKV